jgi:glucose/arabinose dehydrogenase
LRIEDDGSIPTGNPFGTAIYSYGHRNPQGISWDARGTLWSTEHGPVGHDEINIIEAGENYGWPTIRGDETRPNMRTPFIHSGANTWAPAGSEIIGNTMYFGGLRGQALFSIELVQNNTELRSHLEDQFGRIRAVREYDGFLYIATSNRDGRGMPAQNDDRIIRINPDILE